MDEDLYGDLDTSTSALAKTELLQQKLRVESENEKLRQELAVLQQENRVLSEHNHTLETNISSLFVTAQHELSRKTAEIQRLREALEHYERPDRRSTPRDHGRDRSREPSRTGGSRSDADYSRRAEHKS